MPEFIEKERFKVYELGHDLIDQEHYELLRLAGYVKFVAHKCDVPMLKKAIEELKAALVLHFPHEEELMQSSGFPYYEWHASAHQAMLVALDKALAKYSLAQNRFLAENDFVSALEMLIFNHMDEQDRQFVMFLMNRE